MLLAVVFALAAALANAVNLLTQHKASISAPRRVKGWRLALYLPRQPLWLLGVAAAVGSFVFQALALHNGPLSVVQPLLITELVFALVLRRVWIHQDVARSAWVSVSVVCVTLAVFLAVSEPTGGQPYPAAGQWLSAGLVWGGAIAVLALLGLRGSSARRAAALAAATPSSHNGCRGRYSASRHPLTRRGAPMLALCWVIRFTALAMAAASANTTAQITLCPRSPHRRAAECHRYPRAAHAVMPSLRTGLQTATAMIAGPSAGARWR